MCGIAGILDENHHLENQKIIFKDMIQSMKHRGPTSDGLYLEDHIALMHTRLAIVDVEKGLQPMHIGDYTIIYNGECYNTEELRCDLEEKGIVFHTSCDTEVILNAYIYYKENCLHMINGIFAFAIYNSKDKCLFLARDPMGVKPLFYTFVNQILVFASEIKTLLTYPLVKPIIDEHSIHQIAYLGPGRMSGNGVFKNIYEIKGGEYATYSSSSFQIHSYFELKAEPHIDSYEETVEKVRSLVFDSIERQLVSDVKIGAFLSGGLDSSIICAVAANHYKKEGKQLSTFSLEFEENDLYFIPNHFQPTSDIPYIDLMVSTFETKHTKIKLKSSDLINALYKAVDARDLPGMADVDTALLCFCEEVK
ncbi:asparagine synthase (glutamine-hydrolyzing), partial [Traorella massiliensis]|uniref:asparagine synthase (glutamine-hydrolyzing) n=1 Tax=Traorella massiliensis TaxID=1903263 RepID=UPI00248F2BBB